MGIAGVDSVQEVTTQSWFGRIIGAFFGIIIGLFLIIGTFILIFWNEGHGLHTSQSLQQTETMLVSVPISPISPQNDGKPIYFSGDATTNDVLIDKMLGLERQALKLDRTVEMYQWQENVETTTEKQLGGSEKEIKNYTYQPVWSESIIDSREFKDQQSHTNPAVLPITSKHQQAKTVMVGNFKLPKELVSSLPSNETVDLNSAKLENLTTKIKKPLHHTEETIYLGTDPQNPQIGDLRISVTEIKPQTVSVIAQQERNNNLQGFLAPAGKVIALIVLGSESPQQMIHDAQIENMLTMWGIRLASLFIMIIGVFLLFRPLVVLADVVPFLGSIMSFSLGLILFVIGLCLWGVATAIAWFAFRPLVSILLLALIGLICYLLLRRKKQVTT